ncbi:ABC-type multidrug transport system fused ATPase/permease subunit [Streptomyces sp. 1114.5]|uniref:ABC transporter ATP-binding protein n=1 Tax=unclassified Streptomyces TaxID=2593676 RepID=UPI000BD819C0|nr:MULTISPECIES: ABC transporter ATP-binding protein [unclassified Streptomyces]RKT17203.1 ABC-type multidrug transport system fused ATPase/permease subunit [Streptomyces sp. 1114.5]SOB83410.1 ABC-type multidrug transport system, ATPase and permease component [Streptomyces sp. 1331.2]
MWSLRRLMAVDGSDGDGRVDQVVEPAPAVPLRRVFGRFWPYTRGGRRWLVLLLGFVLLGPVVDAAAIWLFKVVVDDVLVPRNLGLFLPVALGYAGLTLMAGGLRFADETTSAWVSERFLLALRTDVFRHLQGLSLGFFERRRLGDVLSRLTSDVEAVETFLLSGVLDAVAYVAELAVFLGVLFYLRWDLAAVALVVAPVFWLTARRFSTLVKAASRERRRRTGSVSALAEETLGNIALVQAYNRQGWEQERFRRESLARFRATMAATRLRALFAPIVELLELVGALIVLGLGAWELVHNRLTLGELLVFVALLSRLYGPIRGISRLSNGFYSASASAERIIELLDQRPQVADPPVPLRPGRTHGAVAFDGVWFRYPDTTRVALFDVSFRAEPGETVALVGESGAGKSTVARLLLRFYDPERGAVRLDGIDLRELALADLREHIAVLLQDTLVIHGTVRENIAYGRPGASDAQILAAAKAADAHEFVSRLPEGYDTLVGRHGGLLSGGQRQRIAIARAMVRDAPVLLLDEPTTGLDVESGQRILEPLGRLMSGRTTIIISHNLLTVRNADRIVLLHEGRVVARGTHRELLARDDGYARLDRLHRSPLREVA